MFDHVTIRVSDVDSSRRFYELAMSTLGYGEPSVGGHFFEWNDLSISQARDDRPLTRNLHLALVTPSREAVDEWWRVMTGAGYEDDGPPGLRPIYRDDRGTRPNQGRGNDASRCGAGRRDLAVIRRPRVPAPERERRDERRRVVAVGGLRVQTGVPWCLTACSSRRKA